MCTCIYVYMDSYTYMLYTLYTRYVHRYVYACIYIYKFAHVRIIKDSSHNKCDISGIMLDALGYKLNKTTTDLILLYKNDKNNKIFNRNHENYLKILLINNTVFAESLCQIVRDGNYMDNDNNLFQISKHQTIVALEQINLLLKGPWIKIRKFIINITSSSSPVSSNNDGNIVNSKSTSSLKTRIRPKSASNLRKSGSNRQITVDNRQEITGRNSYINDYKENTPTDNNINDNRPASWTNIIIQKYLKILQMSYNDINKDKNIDKFNMISGKDLLCVTHKSLSVEYDIASSLLQERFILYQKVLKVRFHIRMYLHI
jgi:hypothetical protein